MIKGYTEKLTGNPLADAYLRGESKVQALYHYKAGDAADLLTRVKDIDAYYQPERRESLVQAVRTYTARVTGITSHTEALLTKLADSNALTVVTGQQAGLFTGPLYTLYKAVTAVAYADYYEKLLNRPVVPIFWVAAEDHDFQEVAEAFFIKDNGELFRSHLREQPFMRTPIGYHKITNEEIQRIVDELSIHLPEGMYREELVAEIASSYFSTENMVDGFVRLLSKWLQDYPILFVNPLDIQIRKLMSDAFRAVIERPVDFQLAARRGEQAVRELGFVPQVALVPTHTLIFTIEHGKRSALDFDPETGNYTLRDSKRKISQQELLDRLEERPQDFSAGVLFRPVTQDYLLPVISYVGGAAEIAYHGMMKEIFIKSGRKTPPLLLRQRAFLLTGQVNRALERFQIKADDVLAGNLVFDRLLEQETKDLQQSLDTLKSCLLAELADFQNTLVELDVQLHRALAKTEFTISNGIDRLSNRARKSLLRKNQDIATSAQVLESWIHPKAKEQERILSPLSPISKYGTLWLKDLWFDTPPDWEQIKCITLE